MWAPITRQQHSRDHLRYGSDLTDAEWAIIAPLLPPARKTRRPRRWPMRELMNAIFYVPRSGLPLANGTSQLRAARDGVPLVSAITGLWRVRGINHQLLMLDRRRVGREANPLAAVLDSQNVKTTEAGGPRGYDAGKKVKGRKRHALVDTDGRALVLHAHRASVQDRDGSVRLLKASRKLFPFIERVFADSAYAADRVMRATVIAIEIVRKHPGQIGFAVHSRRWVVERFFAWIHRNRRLAKDFEAGIASAEAFLYAASVMLPRQLARS